MLGIGRGKKGKKAAQSPDICGLIPLLGGQEGCRKLERQQAEHVSERVRNRERGNREACM